MQQGAPTEFPADLRDLSTTTRPTIWTPPCQQIDNGPPLEFPIVTPRKLMMWGDRSGFFYVLDRTVTVAAGHSLFTFALREGQ
jgi:hypothetical protein